MQPSMLPCLNKQILTKFPIALSWSVAEIWVNTDPTALVSTTDNELGISSNGGNSFTSYNGQGFTL